MGIEAKVRVHVGRFSRRGSPVLAQAPRAAVATVLARACPGAAAPFPGREKTQSYYYSPFCVRPVERPPHACARLGGACIVLPRAAPRRAAARTPRTGYCGRRRRSDRPFRTGLQRWLEKGETLSQAPVFHEFLESIYFQTYKVLLWTESSILAQDERWRRA